MLTSKWTQGLEDIADALSVREKVFLDEQKFETELDDHDQFAWHVVFYEDDVPCAAGRIIYVDEFRIGRICVLKEFRGQHIGDLLTRLLIYKALQFASEIHLHAQLPAKEFYARYGFRPYGDIYDEDGQPHISMKVRKEEVIFPSECGENHANFD